MFQELLESNGGGGGDILIVTDEGRNKQGYWFPTPYSTDNAVLIGVTDDSSHSYTDVFQIENGTATLLIGDLYNGAPLFNVDVSGSTIKIMQAYGGGNPEWPFDYFVAYTE